MKRICFYLVLLASVLAGGVMAACSDSGENGGGGAVRIALSDTTTSTATFSIKAASAGEYAVVVAEEKYASMPDAAVLFMHGRVGGFASGDNTVVVRGLKGDSDNYVYIAVRTAAGMGDVQMFTVRTDGFGGMITVYEQDSCKDIRFHVEVPEGKTILCAIYLREDYYTYTNSYGFTTADLMINWNGKPTMWALTESTDLVFAGYADEDDGGVAVTEAEEGTMLALPGTPFVIVAGEARPNGDGTYEMAFDFDGYSTGSGGGIAPFAATKHEDMTPKEELPYWHGVHATVYCNVTPPAESRHDIDFSVDELTPTSARFTVKPCPDFKMLFYALLPLDDDFLQLETVLGEVGTYAYILDMAGFDRFEDTAQPMTIEAEGLTYGMQYRLFLFGCEDIPPMTQRVVTHDFYPAERTKPAPVLEVAAIPAPAGYEEHPNMVWFNLKSPSKDIVGLKYAVERPKEFVYYINAGYYADYNEFVEALGNSGLTVRDIDRINTDEGLNMMFYSYADDLTRMAAVAYNDEGAPSQAVYADGRTIPYPAETPVNSELFSSLLGNWTLTYKDGVGDVRKVKTTITDGTPVYPSAMTQEAYDVFASVGVSKERADAYYEEFKACAGRFAASVKGRNRLMVEGLNMTSWQTNYMSAWDLFVSSTYNTYATDDCFVDFGPKWFLQIGGDGKVTVPVADLWEYPVSCLDSNSAFMLGAYQYTSEDDYGFDFDITSFDVTVSADGNTLTVEPVVKDGKRYCMTIGQIFGGQLWASGVATSALVMTRGWDGDTVDKKSAGARTEPVACGAFENGPARFRRTRIADVRPVRATVEVADLASRRADRAAGLRRR